MTKRRRIPSVLFSALALSGVVLMGCGNLDRQPLAPLQASAVQKEIGNARSADSPFTVVLSQAPGSDLRASKPIRAGRIYTRTDRGRFSPETSGRLQVRFPDYADAGRVQVKTATFAVKTPSINRKAQIVMNVFSGSSPADVKVLFAPSHVVDFDPPATLTLVLRGEIDPAQIRAYHIEGHDVTEISTQVTRDGKEWRVVFEIPGFSRYGMGDEYVPEAGDWY